MNNEHGSIHAELRMRRHLNNLREREIGNPKTVTHKGAAYTVTANYIGGVTYLDLLRQLIKRDMERQHGNQ